MAENTSIEWDDVMDDLDRAEERLYVARTKLLAVDDRAFGNLFSLLTTTLSHVRHYVMAERVKLRMEEQSEIFE